jgi:hypothetical protein
MFFFRLFTLCSACVSVLVTVLGDSLCKKNRIMGQLSDFERGQIVGARLARTSATKTDTLLGVSRATVSDVITAYTNRGKITSAKRKSG